MNFYTGDDDLTQYFSSLSAKFNAITCEFSDKLIFFLLFIIIRSAFGVGVFLLVCNKISKLKSLTAQFDVVPVVSHD